jgi:hypothetical protein
VSHFGYILPDSLDLRPNRLGIINEAIALARFRPATMRGFKLGVVVLNMEVVPAW